MNNEAKMTPLERAAIDIESKKSAYFAEYSHSRGMVTLSIRRKSTHDFVASLAMMDSAPELAMTRAALAAQALVEALDSNQK